MVVTIGTKTLDAGNAKEFKDGVFKIIKNEKNMVFNMEEVNFIDSSGCGVLLSCLRELSSARGDLKLFNVKKPVRTMFELIRIHKIIDIFNTKEEAVDSFV